MRISELSDVTEVPVPTIKFYLREGLLPRGRSIATNLADYDESHVRRLRLIRALTEVGGLPLTMVRTVLGAVDDPDLPMHEALDPHGPRPSSSLESLLICFTRDHFRMLVRVSTAAAIVRGRMRPMSPRQPQARLASSV